ncbi:MAG: hypothetical protein FWD13_02770 [Treponema sp.]|nr:hypothetical protein [Treponema sp.]
MIFLLFPPFAFSLPLDNLLTLAQRTQLLSANQPIIETQLRDPSPRLIPQNNELRHHVNRALNAVSPNMMVEILYLYRKPAAYHTSANSWDNTQKTGIFNQIMAISTLAGIQYRSSSRNNTMRVFYDYSRIVDGPSSRNALPDPVYRQVPASLTLYARQKDGTFGDNVYRYDYVTNRDAIFFIQENMTTLTYGIIPVIGRGNLRSVMGFIDCGDSILVYAASMSNAFSVPGVWGRISNSFSSRAEAVLNWFIGRLNNQVFIQ